MLYGRICWLSREGHYIVAGSGVGMLRIFFPMIIFSIITACMTHVRWWHGFSVSPKEEKWTSNRLILEEQTSQSQSRKTWRARSKTLEILVKKLQIDQLVNWSTCNCLNWDNNFVMISSSFLPYFRSSLSFILYFISFSWVKMNSIIWLALNVEVFINCSSDSRTLQC